MSRDVLDLIDGAISACDFAAPDAMRWSPETPKAAANVTVEDFAEWFEWAAPEFARVLDGFASVAQAAMPTIARLADRTESFAEGLRPVVEWRRRRLSRMRRLYRSRR